MPLKSNNNKYNFYILNQYQGLKSVQNVTTFLFVSFYVKATETSRNTESKNYILLKAVVNR